MSGISFPSCSEIEHPPALTMLNISLKLIGTLNRLEGSSLSCLDNAQQPSISLADEEASVGEHLVEEPSKQIVPYQRKRKTGCTCKKTHCQKMYC